MTTAQDPIAHAARLLRETAEELRQEYTLSSDRNNWRGDCVAKAAYDEHMAAAQALEDWEAAVGAGGVQPLRSAQERCKLVPLEPTPEMLAALMSPGEAEVLASSPSETFALMLMDRAGIRERYSAMLVAAPQQEAQEPYPIDADPQGIRAIVADAITGALAFGAQGSSPPPEGHWLTPFWEMAREEAMRTRPASVSRDTLYLLRRLLSNQHTLTGSEFRAELEKIVGEAYQQEAQEPALFVSPKQLAALTDPDDPEGEHGRYLPARKTSKGLFTQPLYTAPQPAPAPLSEREAFETAWEKLHGKRPVLWSRLFAEHKMETPAHSEGNYFAATEQAAWKLWQARAALAAHGGQ